MGRRTGQLDASQDRFRLHDRVGLDQPVTHPADRARVRQGVGTTETTGPAIGPVVHFGGAAQTHGALVVVALQHDLLLRRGEAGTQSELSRPDPMYSE